MVRNVDGHRYCAGHAYCGLTYAISAMSAKKVRRGACKSVTLKLGTKMVARRSCTIKLAKGTWRVSVTPKIWTVSGAANSKIFHLI